MTECWVLAVLTGLAVVAFSLNAWRIEQEKNELRDRVAELEGEEDPSCHFGGSRLEHRDGACPCH